MKVNLATFSNSQFDRGRSKVVELLWIVLSAFFLSSSIPGSAHRVLLLRMFGADIGKRVNIKPRIRVKFPWRLVIGENSWIGEAVWIDNLTDVNIGSNSCVSQGVYLCTGSHDWSSPSFDLIVKPIVIGDAAWIAAQSAVGPGVTVGEGAVLGFGSITSKDLEAWTVYSGSPAELVRARKIRQDFEQ